MLKIGFVWNGSLDYEKPHHGEGRYARHFFDVVSQYADVEIIPVLTQGNWDILVLQSGLQYPNEPNAEIIPWMQSSAKKTWFLGWDKTFYRHCFDLAIMWHGRALRRILRNGFAKEGILWYPPLLPVQAEKVDRVVYSPGFHDVENIKVLDIAKRIHDNFGLTFEANRFDWYFNSSDDVPLYLHYYIQDMQTNQPGSPVAILGMLDYTEFQRWLASSRIVIALHRGPSMVPMESFVHGTPAITYYRQEEYLEGSKFLQVNRWKYDNDRLNNEIYQEVEKIVNGIDISSTVSRMCELSNPDTQKSKIKQLIDEFN